VKILAYQKSRLTQEHRGAHIIMATSSSVRGGSFRRGLSARVSRLRRKLQHHSDDTGTQPHHRPNGGQEIVYERVRNLLQ
jgi:hypothetical protein